MKTVVVGLGNEIIADDAVGVLAARALKETVDPAVAVIETSAHGLALLDHFIGYDRAILIDCVKTGKNAPGTIVELSPGALAPAYAKSPHFAGLPEMMAFAEQLQLHFPKDFRIFAIEVADTQTLGGEMTPAVRAAIPRVCDRVRAALSRW
ncbi:MAG: hydrogenase maturation protease, partial [Verrucomicrobiae bacterium]|nr:hydrogenase maturation protease [Verrucomicrobiae bacterium]